VKAGYRRYDTSKSTGSMVGRTLGQSLGGKRGPGVFWLIAAVALAMALPAGCDRPPPTAVPATPTPAMPTDSERTITLADDSRTVVLRAGERFLLKLGEEYDWMVVLEDPAIVSRVANVLTVRGSQGLYEAHKPGRTTLVATGDPPCRKAQPPCGAPSRGFRLEVVVQ